MSIIIFLISLAVLILVHEFGHFIVAKKSGIRVDEFSLGFPPRLWSKKVGETLYSINAIPIGGYVKIFGEDSHSPMSDIGREEREISFQYKPKWIQALVLVAGVTMNIILAWILISLGFVIGLPTPTNYTGYGKVVNAHVLVTDILQNSPAEKAHLETGDRIILIGSGDTKIEDPNITPEKISDLISKSKSAVEITYKRGAGSAVTINVLPNGNIIEGRNVIGAAFDEIGTLKLPVHLALLEGLQTTWDLTKVTAVGLGEFLLSVVKFKANFSEVTGPIGIASVVGQARSLGFVYLISLVALISINLAIINLLPFPALDGGRLLFVGIEAIMGRPISPLVVKWTNTIGFAILILLMIVVTTHDVFRFL